MYGIVKQSGGYIWIDSTPGKGSRFHLYLPVTKEVAQARTVGQAGNVPVPHGSETILLVEDEDVLLELITSALRDGGYTVLEAGSAESALEIAKKHGRQIHLIVTDVILPGLSGRDLTATLSAQFPKIKTIYMSGYTDDLLGRHGVLGPEVTLLEKPFPTRTLLTKVRELLDRAT